MKKEEIQQAYNQLSNEKKDVLVRFLKGQTDQEIAAEIHCSRDNVRKHIQTLIEDFKLKQKGEGKKDRRNELIALFAQHKPELFIDDEGREKQTRVAISYWRAEDADGILAEHLNETLATAGYQTFLLGLSLRNSKYGSQQIEAIIRLCDYFVILLSEISAVREMIEEEVKIAYSLQDAQLHKKPKISVILVNCDWNFLSYDLQGYLSKFPRYQWNSKTNSDSLIQDVLNQLAGYSIQETTPELIAFTPKSNPRPLPSADPELPGGQVDLNSTYYVERDRIEKRCYAEIIRPGALIRIKAPRQMGKTSLMSRILYHAQQSGYQTIA